MSRHIRFSDSEDDEAAEEAHEDEGLEEPREDEHPRDADRRGERPTGDDLDRVDDHRPIGRARVEHAQHHQLERERVQQDLNLRRQSGAAAEARVHTHAHKQAHVR